MSGEDDDGGAVLAGNRVSQHQKAIPPRQSIPRRMSRPRGVS